MFKEVFWMVNKYSRCFLFLVFLETTRFWWSSNLGKFGVSATSVAGYQVIVVLENTTAARPGLNQWN